MVDQCDRFIRDDFFELILGGTSARAVCRACLWRNVVDPVPTQCVIVDLEFPCRPLDRGARLERLLAAGSLPRRLNLIGHVRFVSSTPRHRSQYIVQNCGAISVVKPLSALSSLRS